MRVKIRIKLKPKHFGFTDKDTKAAMKMFLHYLRDQINPLVRVLTKVIAKIFMKLMKKVPQLEILKEKLLKVLKARLTVWL